VDLFITLICAAAITYGVVGLILLESPEYLTEDDDV
jgi:hypothetical protein